MFLRWFNIVLELAVLDRSLYITQQDSTLPATVSLLVMLSRDVFEVRKVFLLLTAPQLYCLATFLQTLETAVCDEGFVDLWAWVESLYDTSPFAFHYCLRDYHYVVWPWLLATTHMNISLWHAILCTQVSAGIIIKSVNTVALFTAHR